MIITSLNVLIYIVFIVLIILKVEEFLNKYIIFNI